MESQPLLPEGVNAIGIAGLIALPIFWLGALVSFVWLLQHFIPEHKLNFRKRPGWIGGLIAAAEFMLRGGGEVYFPSSLWSDPEGRKRFLIFFGVCLVGVLSVGAAVIFGGWATGARCPPGVFQC